MKHDHSDRKVLGLTEEVVINGLKVLARIDTGAQRSSICMDLAEQLSLGPVIKQIKVRSSTGREKRPVVEATVSLKRKRIKARFNIANRRNMKYKMLIGQDILKRGFIIDPLK